MKRIKAMSLEAMKSMSKVTLAVGLLCIVVIAQGNPARAEDDHRAAKAHHQNQVERIKDGVESGELTRQEVRQLRRGHEHVENVAEKIKADGEFTAQERMRLHHAQEVQSHKIARQKHDRQDRD